MKKKYLAVLVSGLLAFSIFAGCKNDTTKPGTDGPGDPGDVEEVYTPPNASRPKLWL